MRAGEVTSIDEEMSIFWMDDIVSTDSEDDIGGSTDNFLKQMQDIWNDDEITRQLQVLEDGYKFFELTTINDVVKSEINQETILLMSAWLKRNDVLKVVLESGVRINTTDIEGRTALHLAAYSSNIEAVEFLIKCGSSLEATDHIQKMTPLHCAASKGHFPCLQLLINHGANVNACNFTDKTPLYYAIQNAATDCVQLLLKNHADPNKKQECNESLLHTAVEQGYAQIVELLLSHGAQINTFSEPDHLTPLHLAAEDGDIECARCLLNAGADIGALNRKQQTALHLAALAQNLELLELLIKRGASISTMDQNGRTPLHCAIVKTAQCYECCKALLRSGADPNAPDAFGYTPLHIAALNELSNCVLLLINYGGDVTLRTNGGISVLTFITRKTPEVIPHYIKTFDASIRVNDHELGDVDCEFKLDFQILVPTLGRRETELLLNFIEVGQKHVLKHPLCETFLYLKWRRIRKFFLFSLFYHIVFVMLYSSYVIEAFLKDCPPTQPTSSCEHSSMTKITGYLLLSLNMILLGKELFQVFHSWLTYVKQWENCLQWLIIVSVFCCVQPQSALNTSKNVDDWQYHVAAIGIFLAWVELMMIIGRFPIFGLYIQMFTTVAINFTKFIAAYFCLLLAFALAFSLLFPTYKSFLQLRWVVLKIFVMMSGELEYEDMFFDNDAPIIHKTTAQIVFLAFVILVTVILTNLMVGLAVNDIQGLQQSAGLDRLVHQTQLIAHLESMLFSRLLMYLPTTVTKCLHNHALLLKSQYYWALHIRPNDPREARIPKELLTSIYQLVVERKDNVGGKCWTQQSKRNGGKCPLATLSRQKTKKRSTIKKNVVKLKTDVDDLFEQLQQFTTTFQQKFNALKTEVHQF